MNQTILYSFRRCPYAMRARLALAISGITVELREVVLRDKPNALLDASPKGTVPVLITANNKLVDESKDIMLWALSQNDPDKWLSDDFDMDLSQTLIANNDGEFKKWLDRYKYADRFPDHTELFYRQQAEKTLQTLEQLLSKNSYLLGGSISMADMALLPFIRQFAFVDKTWFDSSNYPHVQHWLNQFITSSLFESVMHKYPQWHEHDQPSYFPQPA
jgi:glutathione S-transferase